MSFGGRTLALEKWKSAVLFITVTVLGICIAVVLYFYQVLYTSDRFLPGVQIAGVPVAGLTIDQTVIKLNQVLQPANDAPVVFYHDSFSYESSMRKLAVPFDSRKAVNDAWNKEKQRDLGSKLFNLDGAHTIPYPQKIVYQQGPMGQMLQTLNEKLGVKTIDATLEVDPSKGLLIVPGSPGQVVDVNAVMADLPKEWEEFADFRITIVMVEQKPRVNEEDLQGMGELSRFSTWFNSGEINRSANLRLAAKNLNGTMVKPGEIVSFNKIVGPRTPETGFNEALVIVGGKFVPGVGGGICQVSTTLYNACLLAGLAIVERHQHNMAVAYVPLGRDATVSYGTQDYRFQNSTDSPIYIRAISGGGILTVNIYGNLANKQKIGLSSVIDSTTPFKEVNLVDDTLAPGETSVEHAGINGSTVRAFRSFYDAEGKLVKQELLSTNHYRTLDKIIHHGPSSNLPDEASGDSNPEIQPGQNSSGEPTDLDGSNGEANTPPAPEPIDDVSGPTLQE